MLFTYQIAFLILAVHFLDYASIIESLKMELFRGR